MGTITRGLNIVEFRPEPVPTLELRAPSRVVSREELGSGRPFGPAYVERVRTDLGDHPKVFFLRDSFGTALARFVSETVSETVSVNNGGGRFTEGLIEQHVPDIVIYELNERGLRWKLRRERRSRR